MQGAVKERWQELCELAAKEQDQAKLLELTAEICRLLAEKQQRLTDKEQRLKGQQQRSAA